MQQAFSKMFSTEQISFRGYANVTITQEYNYVNVITTRNSTFCNEFISLCIHFIRCSISNSNPNTLAPNSLSFSHKTGIHYYQHNTWAPHTTCTQNLAPRYGTQISPNMHHNDAVHGYYIDQEQWIFLSYSRLQRRMLWVWSSSP